MIAGKDSQFSLMLNRYSAQRTTGFQLELDKSQLLNKKWKKIFYITNSDTPS